MNPLAISATNLRTFERLDLDLPSGCVVIGGENGAGKSTILNAIDVALFADRGELPGLLSLGEDELQLELRFEHAGRLYRVRRGYSGKGRGKTTLDFEALGEHDSVALAEPLTRETAVETQKLIEQTLGLSRTTFRASSFLAQGDGAAFTEAQPRDRKAILAEILGLDIWDLLLDRVRVDLRRTEDELVGLRARIAGTDLEAASLADTTEQLRTARVMLNGAQSRHAVAAHTLDEARAALADNAAAAERLRAAEIEAGHARIDHAVAEQNYRSAVDAFDHCKKKQELLDAYAAAAATVPALEQEIDAYRSTVMLAVKRKQLVDEASRREEQRAQVAEQIAAAVDHAVTLLAKADYLQAHIGDAGDCDRCGQKLGAEAARRAAESFMVEHRESLARADEFGEHNDRELIAIAQLLEQANEIVVAETRDPDLIEHELAAARGAVTHRALLEDEVRQLTELGTRSPELAVTFSETAAASTAAEAAVAAAAEHVGDNRELLESVNVWTQRVDATAAQLEQGNAAVIRLEVALERAKEAELERAELMLDVERWQRAIDLYRLAERAYGRDGIPALIVENAAIPQLEVEANRILGELGGATADCRIELRTQRLLKTTEALRETLDIIIVTPAGARPYETFSGGERTRLNLALRIALARLLAHRRGAESRLLAIDEPEFLDELGVARLADVLRGLAGDFDRVLLVSHHPTLAASFDQAISVVKDGERSRVDVDATIGAPGAIAA